MRSLTLRLLALLSFVVCSFGSCAHRPPTREIVTMTQEIRDYLAWEKQNAHATCEERLVGTRGKLASIILSHHKFVMQLVEQWGSYDNR